MFHRLGRPVTTSLQLQHATLLLLCSSGCLLPILSLSPPPPQSVSSFSSYCPLLLLSLCSPSPPSVSSFSSVSSSSPSVCLLLLPDRYGDPQLSLVISTRPSSTGEEANTRTDFTSVLLLSDLNKYIIILTFPSCRGLLHSEEQTGGSTGHTHTCQCNSHTHTTPTSPWRNVKAVRGKELKTVPTGAPQGVCLGPHTHTTTSLSASPDKGGGPPYLIQTT